MYRPQANMKKKPYSAMDMSNNKILLVIYKQYDPVPLYLILIYGFNCTALEAPRL